MAEVLGTVVGVVSLGIQVSSTIGAYIEGAKCRKDEVESVIRYQRAFQVLLTQIDTLKDSLLKSPIPDTAPLEEALSAVGAQMLQLDAFLDKVVPQDSSASFKSVGQKFRDGRKKLVYPFRRDQLNTLERKLEAANVTLQSAMQVMELEISAATQATVHQIHEESSTANTMLLDIKETIACSTLQSQSNYLMTRRDIEELKSVLEALVSSESDAMSTMQKLVSKPDALRVICDGVVNEQSDHLMPQPNRTFDGQVGDEEPGFHSGLYCDCDTRRRLNRKTRRAGLAFLVREVVIEKPHHPLCPLSVFAHEQSKWSAGISARMLRGLISIALTFTTSTNLGAGGFAISPSFTYHPIRDTSPAQQAILLLERAFYERVWSDQEAKGLERRTIKIIQTSFNSRTSSPFDIGSAGNTLLHDAMRPRNKRDHGIRAEIVKYLTSAGVSRDRPDRRGIYPFQAAFGTAYYYPWPTRQITDMLCPVDGVVALDIQKADSSLKAWYIVSKHTELLHQCPKLTKLYIGHPSEAIVSRNEFALKHALDRNVSLSELATYNAFGNSSLNHLLDWPEGFKLMLHRFGKDLFDEPGEALLLQYALLRSGRICSSEHLTDCQDECPCSNGVKLIMDADIECIAKATSERHWMTSVMRASDKAREMVIARLKEAREKLKESAILLLDPREIEQWDLRCSKILDRHTVNVIAALQRRGHVLPRALATDMDITRGGSRDEFGSVYLELACFRAVVPAAETFYRHGFCDIDVPGSTGYTPIACTPSPSYTAWLIQNGAMLNLRIPETVEGHVVAHELSARLIQQDTRPIPPEVFKTICEPLLKHWYLDACVCGCSSRGCHPFTAMWVRLFNLVLPQKRDVSLKHLQPATRAICRITKQVESIVRDSEAFNSACFRACTFAMLPLAHTCCIHWEWERYDAEERLHMRSEDAFELNRLENLIEEFETEFTEMGTILTDFMQTYWSERMGVVVREIEDQRLSEDEVQNIEALGVSLQITQEDDDIEEYPSQVEYWYRELDALVS